jgi:hypothetical protein
MSTALGFDHAYGAKMHRLAPLLGEHLPVDGAGIGRTFPSLDCSLITAVVDSATTVRSGTMDDR